MVACFVLAAMILVGTAQAAEQPKKASIQAFLSSPSKGHERRH
jgi:hypothetical protein